MDERVLVTADDLQKRKEKLLKEYYELVTKIENGDNNLILNIN
jgi:hypothetical protein